MFGLDIEEVKGTKPTAELDLLGAHLRVSHGAIEASLPLSKSLTYASGIRAIWPRGALGPSEAAKICGEIGVSQTLMFGGAGRSLLRPYSERQYDTRENGTPLCRMRFGTLPHGGRHSSDLRSLALSSLNQPSQFAHIQIPVGRAPWDCSVGGWACCDTSYPRAAAVGSSNGGDFQDRAVIWFDWSRGRNANFRRDASPVIR